MNEFNKFLELLLAMGEKLKENRKLERMFYSVILVFGGAAIIRAIAALIEAIAGL